jgi:hypothetical protein
MTISAAGFPIRPRLLLNPTSIRHLPCLIQNPNLLLLDPESLGHRRNVSKSLKLKNRR